MEGQLEFISIDVWRMIMQIINLIILFLLVKKFLFKPVQNILAKRQQEVDTMYADAQTAQTEAETMRDEYTRNLANAKQEAADIIHSASQTAQSRSEEMIREAQTEAAAIKAKATDDIAREKKKAINEIKDEISGMAVDIAGKVVEREINESDHKNLIDEFIGSVGDAL